MSVTLGLLGLAGASLYRGAEEEADARGSGGRPSRERSFAVSTDVITPGPVTPVIQTYGEVRSRRSLEIRVEVPGRIVELTPAFRDGGEVRAGEVLVRIDPQDAQAALDLARAERAEALSQGREAELALTLAEADLAASERTRDLRASALARQRNIEARGAGTATVVEEAEVALAAAEQAVVGRRQALVQAEAAQEMAEILVERRSIAVREAERTLAHTVVTAPFDGVLSAASAVPGAMMGANEALGTLTDLHALEVAFRVTNAQFSRLGSAMGALAVEVTLDTGGVPVTVAGTLERAATVVGEGQTGRLLYAQLDAEAWAALRPGDFVEVRLSEPELADVTLMPASALAASGEILLVGPEDRLEVAQVRLLRTQGDDVIVADAPAGRTYVRVRTPRLGAGIKVRALSVDGAAEVAADVPETLDLDPERRARLIAFVEANDRMRPEAKARVLAQLNQPMVPARVVERLESRMGG